ncbi:hypothetical protein AB9P05_11915 [Roseivirga sp. BDSF3-8]|uniref:hypothetical protein n=1 Tax=Roseivirga sp. BDSF3-8 TaxID=3241598 RepID=UPI0035321CC3
MVVISMMGFLRRAAWSVVSVFSRAVSFLLVNKMFALYLGPAGITLLAHFQNLISLVTQVPNDGINRGVIRYLAGGDVISPGMPAEKYQAKILWTALGMNVLVLLISCLAFYSFSGFFLDEFTVSFSSRRFVLWLLIFLVLLLSNLLLQAILLSQQRLRGYAILNSMVSLATVIAVAIGVQMANQETALLAFAAGQASGVVFTLSYLIWKGLLPIRRPSFSSKKFRKLSDFLLMALVAMVFGRLLDFFVREYSIERFGLGTTGLWQSVVKLSDTYLVFFSAVISSVYYPYISSMVFHVEVLKKFVRQILISLAIITPVLLIIIYYYREFWLSLLFTSGFADAAFMVDFQLLGDYFYMLSFPLTYLLIAQTRTRTFIFLEVFAAAAYLGCIWWLVPSFGIEALPAAHLYKSMAVFALALLLNRRIIF